MRNANCVIKSLLVLTLEGLKCHQKSVHPQHIQEGKQFLSVQEYFVSQYAVI